jgi:predicted DNA-binding transcriptional regulator YafY
VRRPIRLTARQALSLAAGAGCLRAEGLPISPALERAVEKVRTATPRAERDRLAELERAIAFAQEGEGLGETLRRLLRARAERETVEIAYLSTTGSGITTRRIDPYQLWNHSGFWYCAAFCHLRGETRTFRLSRIRSVCETGEPFEPVPDFDASKYGEGPVYIPPKEALPVLVRFAPDAARLMEEREEHAIVERGRDGSVTVFTLASTPAWVVFWLLPYGEAAAILAPEPVREAMRETCCAILREYGEDVPGAPVPGPPMGKPA